MKKIVSALVLSVLTAGALAGAATPSFAKGRVASPRTIVQKHRRVAKRTPRKVNAGLAKRRAHKRVKKMGVLPTKRLAPNTPAAISG